MGGEGLDGALGTGRKRGGAETTEAAEGLGNCNGTEAVSVGSLTGMNKGLDGWKLIIRWPLGSGDNE